MEFLSESLGIKFSRRHFCARWLFISRERVQATQVAEAFHARFSCDVILGDREAVNRGARKINRRDERFHESLQGCVRPLRADSYQTVSKRLGEWWHLIGQKNPLFNSAQLANSSFWGRPYFCRSQRRTRSPTTNDPQTGGDPQIWQQMIPNPKWAPIRTANDPPANWNGVWFLGFFKIVLLIFSR